jgi:hypothetical protein
MEDGRRRVLVECLSSSDAVVMERDEVSAETRKYGKREREKDEEEPDVCDWEWRERCSVDLPRNMSSPCLRALEKEFPHVLTMWLQLSSNGTKTEALL